MSVAIIPGSFDPITNGHLDIAEKAAKMFDHVYLVIMTNTHKHYLFTAKERTDIAKDAVQELENVTVIERSNELAVNVASELGAMVMVRGVRNSQDFLYEQQIAAINQRLNSKINTVLLFTNQDNNFIASSMVKEVAKFDADITQFLPKKAAEALKKKLG